MSNPEPNDAGVLPGQPGMTRTWWHPLLTRLLDHVLATAYTVREEVLVGKMPLRLDILLIRREVGTVPEAARRDLAALLPLLNRFTLIQFKGPTDTLEAGDLAQLAGCAFLWHGQQVERVPHGEISLILLAPVLNDALRNEVAALGGQMTEQEPGIHRLSGMPFAAYLVETDVMGQRGEPVLSLVSRVFLNRRERIIEQLTRTGHTTLLLYMLQQVQQFRNLGEDFAMQHKNSEYLGEVEEELLTTVLHGVPAEKLLRGLTPKQQEEVLAAIPPEKRLSGLSAEELATGLSEEQAARLRELLERRRNP